MARRPLPDVNHRLGVISTPNPELVRAAAIALTGQAMRSDDTGRDDLRAVLAMIGCETASDVKPGRGYTDHRARPKNPGALKLGGRNRHPRSDPPPPERVG